jgi:hypothetical protein
VINRGAIWLPRGRYLWPAGDSNLNKTNTPNQGIKRGSDSISHTSVSFSSLSLSISRNNRITKFTAAVAQLTINNNEKPAAERNRKAKDAAEPIIYAGPIARVGAYICQGTYA